MKTLIISLIFMLCGSLCMSQYCDSKADSYLVYKIKRNNEYYEIYAKKGKSHFKIISKKESSKLGIKIKKGKCYNFDLTSLRELLITEDGVSLFPANYLHVSFTHGNTLIKIDGSNIYDLHYASNLKGLYLIE